LCFKVLQSLSEVEVKLDELGVPPIKNRGRAFRCIHAKKGVGCRCQMRSIREHR